jgi:hypothetical protein
MSWDHYYPRRRPAIPPLPPENRGRIYRSEELKRDQLRLDWMLTASPDQLSALTSWTREGIDLAMKQEGRV